MIKKLTIRNLKSISSVDLDLSNLTLLTGPNSSGKSSVIQAILILRNALFSTRDSHPDLISLNTPGRQSDFESIFRHGAEGDILLSAETFGSENEPATFEVALGSVKRSPQVIEYVSMRQYPKPVPVSNDMAVVKRVAMASRELKVLFELTDKSSQYDSNSSRVRFYNKSFFDSSVIPNHQSIASLYELSSEETWRLYLNNTFDIFDGVKADVEEEDWLSWYEKAEDEKEIDRTTELKLPVSKIRLEQILLSDLRGRLRSQRELTDKSGWLSKIVYLGPFRTPEQEDGQTTPLEIVGRNAGSAMSTLRLEEDTVIKSPNPKTGRIESRRLRDAISDWGDHLELFSDIETGAAKRMLFDRGAGSLLGLTSVGSAVSQVLPVLLTCLLAPEGSVILIEQPEVHLHPRLQQLIADFLLGVSKTGKQLIVETHSDHLIDRLRLRMAEESDERSRESVRVCFFGREDGETSVRSFHFDEYGGVPDWPKGFFDESINESEKILLASLKKFRSESDL